jgi:AcrR family transcriptional regulator
MVAFSQRERLLAATVAVVAERGYNAATIAAISDVASVSRRTFYENFAGKEECFLATYDALDGYFDKLLEEAIGEASEWPEQAAAALASLLRFLASRPDIARVYLVEATVAGQALAQRREQSAERYIDLLERGREYRTDTPQALTEGLAEALVGGIVTLLGRRIVAGESTELAAFAPSLVEFALSPYIGPDAARSLAAQFS